MQATLFQLKIHFTVNITTRREFMLFSNLRLNLFFASKGTCYTFNSGVNATGHQVPPLISYRESNNNGLELVHFFLRQDFDIYFFMI
jgi:hypothetical protein